MAKVIEYTPLELRPGADEQEFIKFFNEQYAPLGKSIGWIGTIYKADRGPRAGRLLVIWEISSVEHRDRMVPTYHNISEEGMRLLGPKFVELDKIRQSYIADWPITHYIEQVK
jgi:hypothetical protein